MGKGIQLTAFALGLAGLLTACSSKPPNRFSKDGIEEIKLGEESVDASKIKVVQTRTLDAELKLERAKREGAEHWASFYKGEYELVKSELVEARLRLGLPATRAPCAHTPCGPNEVRPSMTLSEELAVYSTDSNRIPASIEKIK